MEAHSPTYLALKINALLDGQTFYDHWREKFRNPQPYGPTIKSFCPFHVGESFRTFLLDLQKRTFRCTITQCKAAAGGTFVELHGLLLDKPFLEGVLELLATFKIAFPDDVRLLFAATLTEQARQLVAEGKLDAAERSALLGLKRDPTSPALQLLLAEICELRGDPAEARPYYQSVLDEAIAEKDWSRASTVLDRLRSLEPDQSAYTEQAAAIAEAQGDCDRAIACYLELASRPDTPPDARRSWLEKARSMDPFRPETLECLGALAEESGQTDEALATWKSLADRYRRSGLFDKALAVLDRIARVQPETREIEEQRIDLLLGAHRTDEAAQLLKALAERALEQGAVDQTERYLRRLADVLPNDIEAHWLLLTLFERTDREDNAALIADHLLAIADAQTLGDRYRELLERLRRWRPNNTLYCERLAMYCASQGDFDTALQEMQALAERSLRRGATAEALQRIQTMSTMAADQPRRRLAIAEFLAARGFAAEAFGEYEAVARQSVAGDPALAEEVCSRALELDASQPAFHEILFRLYLPDHPDRAVERCREIVELRRTRGETENALAPLEQVCQRLPHDVESRLSLAALYVETGQPQKAISVLEEVAALEPSAEQAAKAVETTNVLAAQSTDSPRVLKLQASLYRRLADQDALVETLILLGAMHQGVRSFAEAEAAYSEILALRPDETRALQACAEVVRRLRGFAAAKPIFQRYLEQLVSKGRYDEAARIYQRGMEWAPDDAQLRQGLGSLLAKQGHPERARAQWELAAALYLTADNNFAGAAQCYEAILACDPDDEEIPGYLASLYVLLDQPDAAGRVVARTGEPIPEPSCATHEVLFPACLLLDKKMEAFHHAKALSDLYGSHGQPERALAYARKMVELQPQEPATYEHLSEMLKKQNAVDELCRMLETLAELQAQEGDVQKAAETLNRYLALRPDSTAVRKRYAELIAQAGRQGELTDKWETLIGAALETGHSAEAERLFAQALQADPGNLGLHERWVRFLYDQKREQEGHQALLVFTDHLFETGAMKRAVQAITETLKQYPRAAELHVRLGDLYLAMNATGQAIAAFKRAAGLFAEQGEVAAAHALAEKTLALDPQDVATRSALVDWLVAAGETEIALAHARTLASQYAERNLLDLAEREYRRILSHDPNDLASWQKLLEMIEHMATPHEHISEYLLVGEMLTQRGLLEEAVEVYRRAIQWDPDNVEVRRILIETRLQMGPEREAIADYLQLGEVLARRGEANEALRTCERILLLDPNNAAARNQMKRLKPELSGPARTGLKRQSSVAAVSSAGDERTLRGAIEDCRHILQAKPDNAAIRARMGDLLFQLGEVQEALKEWDTASAQLLMAGEFEPVIRLCERILQIDSKRPQIQDRLARAKLMQASMTEIQSVIESLEDPS